MAAAPGDESDKGEASYGNRRKLPCLECGYDLRGAAVTAGWVTCSECGERWSVARLREAAIQGGRISNGSIIVWLLAMPMFYAPVLVLGLASLGSVNPSGIMLSLLSLLAVVAVGWINRNMARKVTHRMRGHSRGLGESGSALFWLNLILMTLAHVGLTMVYSLVSCCGCVLFQ